MAIWTSVLSYICNIHIYEMVLFDSADKKTLVPCCVRHTSDCRQINHFGKIESAEKKHFITH